MSNLKTAAIAALSVVLATPAFGGELEDGLAAIYAQAAGQWTGVVSSIDPSSGAQTPTPFDFTLVVTSEDGLDFAYWGADGLTVGDYQGDGAMVSRTWSAAGDLRETQNATVALAEATIPEAKVWSVSTTVTGPDGNSYDLVSTYSLGVALSYRQEASPTGVEGAPKIILATGAWTRP